MISGGLLAGIVVLELGHGLPVGYAGRVLRGLGAAVIKVEDANSPDWLRSYGASCGDHAESCSWWHLHGSKCRALLALEQSPRTAIARMLASTDIAIVGEGALANSLEDALALSVAHEASFVRVVPSFGLPLEVVPAADESAGMPTGLRDPFGLETPPEGLRFDMVEVNAGVHVAATASLALSRLLVDPTPIRVDVGVYESCFSTIEISAQTMLLSQRFDAGAPDMVGSPLAYPYYGNDGKALVINIYGRGVWARTCRALGREDLVDDPRFEETFARYQFAEDLRELLDAFCGSLTRDEAIRRLWAERIPSAPVLEPAELVRNEQVADRGVISGCRVGSPFVIDGIRDELEPSVQTAMELLVRSHWGDWVTARYSEQFDAVRIELR